MHGQQNIKNQTFNSSQMFSLYITVTKMCPWIASLWTSFECPD